MDDKYWPGSRPPKSAAAGTQQHRAPSDMTWKGKVYRLKGEDVELFSIGDLAGILGKKPVTIRMWESKGWIPRANWRSPAPKGEQIPGRPVKGRRLYTRPQVELLYKASQKFQIDSKVSADWPGFREFIKVHWPL